MMAPPGYPKTKRTPSASSAWHMISPPVRVASSIRGSLRALVARAIRLSLTNRKGLPVPGGPQDFAVPASPSSSRLGNEEANKNDYYQEDANKKPAQRLGGAGGNHSRSGGATCATLGVRHESCGGRHS